MGKTKIEWCDRVWNPAAGCKVASPGCDNCYAARLTSGRLRNLPMYQGLAVGGQFTGEIRLAPDRLGDPLRWRTPAKVFVNSMSDLFHPGVPDEYIAQVFAVMASCPQHTFLILTKRHARMQHLMADECRCGAGHAPGVHLRSAMEWAATPHSPTYVPGLKSGVYFGPWPLRNVWLGVSVEDQQRAAMRLPCLRRTPAAVRWVSAEPLIDAVDFDPWLHDEGCQWMSKSTCTCQPGGKRIGWVVAGGESGAGARPMSPAWVDLLRGQCRNAGTPFFMKQAGTLLARDWGCADPHGRDPNQWPTPYPREWPTSTTTVGARS